VLAEYMHDDLVEMVGWPLTKGEGFDDALKRMQGLIADDEIMYQIVKKIKPKYKDSKIKAVILAFRKAYSGAYFQKLEADFFT